MVTPALLRGGGGGFFQRVGGLPSLDFIPYDALVLVGRGGGPPLENRQTVRDVAGACRTKAPHLPVDAIEVHWLHDLVFQGVEFGKRVYRLVDVVGELGVAKSGDKAQTPPQLLDDAHLGRKRVIATLPGCRYTLV